MNVGISFTLLSIVYNFILNIIYLRKERIKSIENTIYTALVIATLLGSIEGIFCYIGVKHYVLYPLFSEIVSKGYLVFLLVWFSIFTLYVIYISNIKIYNVNRNRFIKIVKLFVALAVIIFLLICFLPIVYISNDNIVYTTGPSVKCVYGFSLLYFLVWIICTIKRIKNLNKKFIPVLTNIILLIVVVTIQKYNPALLLVTSSLSLVTFLMYFTIENPDVKQMVEMERNNEITEQSYIDKSNFIFEMTQEVREPLNYIKNTSKVLIDNDPNKETYKEGLGYIYNASRQLDFVVNDVLNVSTLDVQKVKILNNKYNLNTMYEDLVKRIEASINNGVKFRYTIPNSVPYLYGDNIKLKQVLYSLLMNAVKKTENGFIEFNINTIEKYDVCRVIFRITDSGCGIGLEKINEILSVTGELNKEDIVNLEKSEFNIELCQKIIKSLGGNLLIKSKVGKGTEIILTLDQKVYREEEKVINNISNTGRKKVLVLSQDKKTREIIKKVLNENEISGSYILYGGDLIDRIKSGKRYDYILIEDEMKEMNGYETIKKLKDIEGFKTPCIVMLKENKEKIKKYYIKDGFSDYILTRELRSELKRIIDKY